MVSIRITDEKEIERRKYLLEFISKYFDYSKEGLSMIKEQIFNPKIDENYAKFFKDDTMRGYCEFPDSVYESQDQGWKIFKEWFGDIVKDFNITYEDFAKNTFLYEKNRVKIFKFIGGLEKNSKYLKRIISNFGDDNIQKHITLISEQIGKYKISDKAKKKIVVSCNPIDYLLVSTAETWGSCLNLNSDYGSCFWAGLPAMINDKNRAVIYETDGQRKSAFGLEADRFLSRSWSLLSEKDEFTAIRFFPSGQYDERMLTKIIGHTIVSPKQGFISKYEVEPIYNDLGFSLGIYVDNCHVESDHKYHYGSSGFQSTHKNMIVKRYAGFSLYSHSGGLKALVRDETSLANYRVKQQCPECSNTIRVVEDFAWDVDRTQPYCKKCYDKIFVKCGGCGTGVKANIDFTFEGQTYCKKCRKNLFEDCQACGKTHRKENVYKFTLLELEDPDNKDSELVENSYKVCKNCIDSFLKEKGFYMCKDCGKIFSLKNEEEYVKEGSKYVCVDCYVDRKQIKFEFAA